MAIDFSDLGAQPAGQSKIDFSDLGGQPVSQNTQPWYQDASDAITGVKDAIANTSVGKAVGKAASVAGNAQEIARQAMGTVIPETEPVLTAMKYAPDLAQAEGQKVSDIGEKAGYPLTGAAIGTGVAMIPDIASAYAGLKGLHEVPSPTLKGLLNTPQELGPQYAALEEQAGVSGKLPIQRGTMPKFPGLNGLPQNAPPPEAPHVAPLSYPKDVNTYLNFARDRVDSVGGKLTAQELADHKSILSDILSKMKAKGQGGTPTFANASQVNSDITNLQNANVPGRVDLNKAYSVSSKQQAAMDAIKKYGVGGGEVLGAGALGASALKKLYEYFKK